MRQMAGDREHKIMMIRRHDLDFAPSAAQNARSFSTASASVPSGGVRMHQRLIEQLGETGIGTGMLGAGDGMRGNEMHGGRQMRAISLTTAPLTEPTSETIAPGFR